MVEGDGVCLPVHGVRVRYPGPGGGHHHQPASHEAVEEQQEGGEHEEIDEVFMMAYSLLEQINKL